MSKLDQIRALRERRFEETKPTVNSIPVVINTSAQRQAKWRNANLELNRQRAREGMRKHRAALKANAS